MSEVQNENGINKMPRGQAGLNERAARLYRDHPSRHAEWHSRLSAAEKALVRRAAKGLVILRKNLPRLAAALDVAEGKAPAVEARNSPAMNDVLGAAALFLERFPDAVIKIGPMTLRWEE